MAKRGTVPPMVPIADRPVPPLGLEVLTIPEASAYAREAAEQRGDQRGRLAPEDIRRDIAAGVLQLGQDAYWVNLKSHPKGGWWVVTRAAVDRRIQERVSRGRGRPPVRPTVKEEGEGEGVQVVPTAEVPAPLDGNAPETPPMPLWQASDASGKPSARVPQIDEPPGVMVERGKGHEVVPVADSNRYRAALAAAIVEQGTRAMFYVCHCGWAGQEKDLARVKRDGRGGVVYDQACPECGEIRSLEGALVLVGPVVRDVTWIRKQVEEAKELTRNDAWKSAMRKHLRELALCRRQAVLDEPVTPGVTAQVKALVAEIEQLLADTIVLPPVMRNEPTWSDWRAVTEPKVKAVMDDALPPGFGGAGPILTDVLMDAVDRGASALATVILMGQGGARSLWPTLEWLHEARVETERTPTWERLERVYVKVRDMDPVTIQRAWQVLVELRPNLRRHGSIDAAARERMREDVTFQYRWGQAHEGATALTGLFTVLELALGEEARRLVQIEVEAEVERLAQLASSEAVKKGRRRPIEVAASWCKNGRQLSPEMWRLVGYPLAQRLQG